MLGGEGAGDRTKVRYANFDDEMIGMTTTITNEGDSGAGGGAFGSQVRSSASPKKSRVAVSSLRPLILWHRVTHQDGKTSC